MTFWASTALFFLLPSTATERGANDGDYEFFRTEKVDGEEVLKICGMNTKLDSQAEKTWPGTMDNEDTWKFFEPRSDYPSVLVTVPNGVGTYRGKGTEMREKEFMAAELGEWLSKELGVPVLRLVWPSDDPSFYDALPDEPASEGFVGGTLVPFKEQIKKAVEDYPSIRAVVDLHVADYGSEPKYDFAVNVGTGMGQAEVGDTEESEGLTLNTDLGNSAYTVIEQAFGNHGKMTERNYEGQSGCCDEATVARFASEELGLDAFTFYMNNASMIACTPLHRDPMYRDPFIEVLTGLEDAIIALTTHFGGCLEGFVKSSTSEECTPCAQVPNCFKHKLRCFDGTSNLRCHTCLDDYELDDVANTCTYSEVDNQRTRPHEGPWHQDEGPLIANRHHPMAEEGQVYTPLPVESSSGRKYSDIDDAMPSRGARSMLDAFVHSRGPCTGARCAFDSTSTDGARKAEILRYFDQDHAARSHVQHEYHPARSQFQHEYHPARSPIFPQQFHSARSVFDHPMARSPCTGARCAFDAANTDDVGPGARSPFFQQHSHSARSGLSPQERAFLEALLEKPARAQKPNWRTAYSEASRRQRSKRYFSP